MLDAITRLPAFLSTVATFGTALALIAAELSIEAFLPADEATAGALRSTGCRQRFRCRFGLDVDKLGAIGGRVPADYRG